MSDSLGQSTLEWIRIRKRFLYKMPAVVSIRTSTIEAHKPGDHLTHTSSNLIRLSALSEWVLRALEILTIDKIYYVFWNGEHQLK